LAGHDIEVIERVDVREVLLASQFCGVQTSLVVGLSMEDYPRAKAPASFDFDPRRGPGHYDRQGESEVAGVASQSKRVIACGRGNDAAGVSLGGKQAQGIPGAPFFEAAGGLSAFHLAEDLAAEQLRKAGGFRARGEGDRAS
jgi:hypothetical protein